MNNYNHNDHGINNHHGDNENRNNYYNENENALHFQNPNYENMLEYHLNNMCIKNCDDAIIYKKPLPIISYTSKKKTISKINDILFRLECLFSSENPDEYIENVLKKYPIIKRIISENKNHAFIVRIYYNNFRNINSFKALCKYFGNIDPNIISCYENQCQLWIFAILEKCDALTIPIIREFNKLGFDFDKLYKTSKFKSLESFIKFVERFREDFTSVYGSSSYYRHFFRNFEVLKTYVRHKSRDIAVLSKLYYNKTGPNMKMMPNMSNNYYENIINNTSVSNKNLNDLNLNDLNLNDFNVNINSNINNLGIYDNFYMKSLAKKSHKKSKKKSTKHKTKKSKKKI